MRANQLKSEPEFERELALAYFDCAEKWADEVEENWDWNATEAFGGIARSAYDAVTRDIPTTEFHGGACDLMVAYLNDTWEFGTQLRRWYKKTT
jgi:hypothetical protein